MPPMLLMALIVFAPVVVALALKVNAAVLFMSVCVDEVLVLLAAGDISTFASAVSPTGNMSTTTVRLGLLLLPPILTSIFMIHSINGSPKVVLNLIPAVCVGLLLALLIEPLLSPGLQGTIEHAKLWHQFSQAQTLIVSLGALISLLFLWLGRHHGGKKHAHHLRQH